MYERYSLAELGEISKRYDAEFGKDKGFDPAAAAARALRNRLRESGKTVRFKNRRDRPRIDERIGARVERTMEQLQGLANTGKETAANVGQTAEKVSGHLAPAVEAAAKPVEAAAKPIEAGGKAVRNIGLGAGGVLAGGGIGFGAMVRPRKEKIVIEPGKGIVARRPQKG